METSRIIDGLVVHVARAGPVRTAALGLRGRLFRAGAADDDRHDRHALHLLVTAPGREQPLAVARAFLHPHADAAACGYSGEFYELAPLARFEGPFMEVGRLAAPEGRLRGAALRALFGGLAWLCRENGVRFLFGCASLPGARPEAHRPALGLLAGFRAPPSWRPRARARPRVALDPRWAAGGRGWQCLPGPLRVYLGMGARLSDHAMIDAELDTLHLFAGLEVARVPARRARALARLAGERPGMMARA